MTNAKKWKKIFLIISIVLFVIGVLFAIIGIYTDKNYKENSMACDAVITNVKTESSSDEWTSYSHRYYGEYTIDDKIYSDIEILKTETHSSKPDYQIGQIIRIKVDGDNPSKLAEKGTIPYIIGFSLLGCGVFLMIIRKLVKQV